MVRMKHRYFGLHVTLKSSADQHTTLNANDLYNAITERLREIHGELHLASVITRLSVKYCNAFIRTAIVRCDHKHFDHVASTLPFIIKIGDVFCKIRTVVVSGTIIRCKQILNAYIMKQLSQEGVIIPRSERY